MAGRGASTPGASRDLAFCRLPLFADCTACLHFADIVRGERNLALIFAEVCRYGADFLPGLESERCQWFYMGTHGDEEGIHRVARDIRSLMNRVAYALD